MAVKAVVPGARLVEAAPDFVGLTDVAQVLGPSRQNLHKLMNKHRHAFRPPCTKAAPPSGTWPTCWRGCMPRAVTSWWRSLIDVAQAARQINLAREAAQTPPLPADMSARLEERPGGAGNCANTTYSY
jgi:hypothetical protein